MANQNKDDERPKDKLGTNDIQFLFPEECTPFSTDKQYHNDVQFIFPEKSCSDGFGELNAFVGEYTDLNFVTYNSLGELNAYIGENLYVNIPDFVLSSSIGEYSILDGMTIDQPLSINFAQIGETALLIRPSTSTKDTVLDFTYTHTGEHVLCSMSWSALAIDLCRQCEPEEHEPHNIVFDPTDNFDARIIKHKADYSYCVFELAMSRQLPCDAYIGEYLTFGFNDPYYFNSSLYASVGETASRFKMGSVSNDVNVCYGNITPYPHYITHEASSDISWDCRHTYGYAGEYTSFNMQIGLGFTFDEDGATIGEVVSGIFEVTKPITPPPPPPPPPPPYEPKDIEFEPLSYIGEIMRFEFKEITWHGYIGEYSNIDIVSKYDVEFISSGCLDNEYVYYDENGISINEEYKSIAIEFLPYSHRLKARCIY